MEAPARHERVADGRERLGVAVTTQCSAVNETATSNAASKGSSRTSATTNVHSGCSAPPAPPSRATGRTRSPTRPDQRRHLAVAAADVEHAGVGGMAIRGEELLRKRELRARVRAVVGRIQTCTGSTIPAMEIVTGRPPFAWAETMQYSQSVVVGDLVFTAGQGGFGDDGEVVEGGFDAQLRQTFANLDAALAVPVRRSTASSS